MERFEFVVVYFELQALDHDRDAEFRETRYGIISSSISSMFSVDAVSGDLSLLRPLSPQQTLITVEAYNTRPYHKALQNATVQILITVKVKSNREATLTIFACFNVM